MRSVSSRAGAAYSRDTDPVTNRQPTSTAGWWRLLLAALAAALVTLLGVTSASAVTLPVLETRVGASTPTVVRVVGVHESVSAGQQWAKAPPRADLVVATGVAAKAESRVLSKVDDLPCNCFVKDTKVQTKDGPKPIQDIRPGDQVWAKNLTTGESELRPVTGLFQKQSTTLMTITLASGATVVVTQEHPFMVDGQGWVLSGDLRAGDRLTQRDGGASTVAAIEVRPGGQTVYNFEVAGNHNYYITDAQLLVHNCKVIPGNPFRGPNAPQDAFAHLKKYHGLDPNTASNRLHVIKKDAGLGAADDVVIGRTGDVYDARTGELLDTLTNPGLGRAR